MDAKTYLDTYGPEHTDQVCRKAKTKLSYFRQCALGHRHFSRNLAQKLSAASGGEMSVMELLFPPERKKNGSH